MAKRAIAYVRVSDEGGRGEDLVSPTIQLTSIRDHCHRNDYQIVETLEDIDLTGRLWKRRKMEHAVAEVEAGHADVIVVWKISRVARNRLDWNIAVDRVETSGGRLESATEPFDTSTSSGRFARGVLAELAAFESERIGESWRDAHKLRTDRGLPHYGPPRLGYSYEKRVGYTVNPEQAEIVRELYRRYVAGAGVGELVVWLAAEGVPVPKSGATRWTRYGVQYYLDSGFAAGLVQVHAAGCGCRRKSSCSNRVRRRGAHDPILTAPEWAAYEAARSARRGEAPRRGPTHRLAGCVVCGGCGHPMQLQGSNGVSRAAYICRRNRCSAGVCPAPAWVRRSTAEEAVFRWLPKVAGLVEDAAAEAEPAAVSEVRRERLSRRVLAANEALGKLAADLARDLIPESAYVPARDELMRERQVAVDELAAAARPSGAGTAVETAATLLDAWDDDSAVAEVNAMARLLCRVVVPRGGAPVVEPAWKE